MRSLLLTQLTPENDNLTYPNASINVSLTGPRLQHIAWSHSRPLSLRRPACIACQMPADLSCAKVMHACGSCPQNSSALCNRCTLQACSGAHVVHAGPLQVGISHPGGCVPWWSKRISAGDQVCPKDCELSGFKEGYNLGRACSSALLCPATFR